MNIRNLAFLIACIAAALPVGAASAETAIETVRVYRADGSLQCETGKAVPPAEMAKELEAAGAAVISAQGRVLPGPVIQLCGSPTGRVNTYVILKGDWLKIVNGPAGAGEFERWIFDDPTVDVAKHDGSLQCETGGEITLDAMQKELESAGIDVLKKRKDTDGLMRITLCGSPTGNLNVFAISPQHWLAAKALGFAVFPG